VISPITQSFWRCVTWGGKQLAQVGRRKPVLLAASVASVAAGGVAAWLAWPFIAPTLFAALSFVFLC
jgi:hypothetical protein